MPRDALPTLHNQECSRAVKLEAAGLGETAHDKLSLPRAVDSRDIVRGNEDLCAAGSRRRGGQQSSCESCSGKPVGLHFGAKVL